MNHSLNIHSGTTLLCVALRHKGDKAKIEKATLLCLKHVYSISIIFYYCFTVIPKHCLTMCTTALGYCYLFIIIIIPTVKCLTCETTVHVKL